MVVVHLKNYLEYLSNFLKPKCNEEEEQQQEIDKTNRLYKQTAFAIRA